MASAKNIIKLATAAISGNRAQAARMIETLAQEAESHRHTHMAQQLRTLLPHAALDTDTANSDRSQMRQVSRDPRVGDHLLREKTPEKHLDDLVLPAHVGTALQELVQEQQQAGVLLAAGSAPRNRLLLVGPPGNGKTSVAGGLAHALDLPFVVPQYTGLFNSYMGKTAQHLSQVFDYAAGRPCVLFFDEFDAMGSERSNDQDVGEIKRVVIALLSQIDELPHDVVIVTATNHAELLDRAVWRRFQIRLELPAPSPAQVGGWLADFSHRHNCELGQPAESLAAHLKGVSFAEVEEFGWSLWRRQLLTSGQVSPAEITAACLQQWDHRVLPQTASLP